MKSLRFVAIDEYIQTNSGLKSGYNLECKFLHRRICWGATRSDGAQKTNRYYTDRGDASHPGVCRSRL